MVSLTLRQSLAIVLALASDTLAKDWDSPAYTWLYEFPLPIPPPKEERYPNQAIINPVTGKKIRYYEVEVKEFTAQVYPNLKPANLVGYDGIAPGPTFLMERGEEAVVRFINHAKMASSVHLHGSPSRTPWDGWAEDVFNPGQYKDYYYPNNQNARTLWYHDHAIDHTAENAYFGQAGAYILHDSAEDSLGLPSGYGVYDIPLILSAKQYNSDGTLYSPANEQTSLYGDVIHVNGQPWPYLKVEPRKYRFRLLDAAISRTFFLYLEDLKANRVEFEVISSDAGLLTGPQKVKDLYISMAERYEIVIDFSKYKGENVTMRNTRGFAADVDYLHTDKVMRFVVSDESVNDKSEVPSSLRAVPFPKDKTGVDQHFLFHRTGSDWRINGVIFADVNNRVLAKPKRGTVEVWELENSSGGWSHPIHIHLVDFRVIKRVNGRSNTVFPYESQGLKDVVWVGPGETVTVEAHYAPWPGVYMFHCHNLIHEDHEMMAAFNVTKLEDLGYDEEAFADPMQLEWRSKNENSAASSWDAIKSRVEYMAKLQPYNNEQEVESRLDAYWATKTNAPSPSSTPSSTPSTLVVSTTTSPVVTSPATTPASSTITSKATTTSKSDDDDKKKKTSSTSTSTTSSKKKRGMRFRGVDMEMPKRTAAPQA
ncbi:bilirubin oxidase [Colletotrichum costaricense]|uniref:Bilirubin oxidase n=1 Tax=Colletotrichum costaricense TaxID=1209916 RepID=A0AAI9Z6V1_9PEZI|nr:bilirubin oxidase [Colletotrichum costaricense]KAK1534811.1 bilirubin oxidase [Colletotrichum costaricense]